MAVMSERPETPLLDQVNLPADLRKLERGKLRQLADELRTEMIDAVDDSHGAPAASTERSDP